MYGRARKPTLLLKKHLDSAEGLVILKEISDNLTNFRYIRHLIATNSILSSRRVRVVAEEYSSNYGLICRCICGVTTADVISKWNFLSSPLREDKKPSI